MISNKKLKKAFMYRMNRNTQYSNLYAHAEQSMTSAICNTYHIHRGSQKRKVIKRVTDLMKPYRLKLLLATGSTVAKRGNTGAVGIEIVQMEYK